MNQPITTMTSEEQRFQFLLAFQSVLQWPGETDPLPVKGRCIAMENSQGVSNGHFLYVCVRPGLRAGYSVLRIVKNPEGIFEELQEVEGSESPRFFQDFTELKNYMEKMMASAPHEHAVVPLDDRFVEPVPYSRILSLQNLPEFSPEEAFMHSLEGIYSYTFGSETTVVRTGCVISDRGYVFHVSTPENALDLPSSFFSCKPASYANLKNGARQFDVSVYYIDPRGYLSTVTDDRYKPVSKLCHGFEGLCAFVREKEDSLPDLEEKPGLLKQEYIQIPLSALLPEPSGSRARENIIVSNTGAGKSKPAPQS